MSDDDVLIGARPIDWRGVTPPQITKQLVRLSSRVWTGCSTTHWDVLAALLLDDPAISLRECLHVEMSRLGDYIGTFCTPAEMQLTDLTFSRCPDLGYGFAAKPADLEGEHWWCSYDSENKAWLPNEEAFLKHLPTYRFPKRAAERIIFGDHWRQLTAYAMSDGTRCSALMLRQDIGMRP